MSTPEPSAATSAPASARREPARADKDSAEAPVEKESLCAHAQRSIKTTARTAITAAVSAVRAVIIPVLDVGIALLQSLRKRVGSAQDAGKETGDDRPGSRKDRAGGRRDDADSPGKAEAPAPRRRFRAILVYLSILLVGGTAGGALAYHLLEERPNSKVAEVASPAVTKPKNAEPSAAAATNPEETPTENADAEKQLEEAQAKLEETQEKLEQVQENIEKTQTARVNAEKKLAAYYAAYTKSAADMQKKLDVAEKRLATMLAAERGGAGHRPSLASRGSAARSPSQVKAGNCDLNAGNLAALKDCLKDFNR